MTHPMKKPMPCPNSPRPKPFANPHEAPYPQNVAPIASCIADNTIDGRFYNICRLILGLGLSPNGRCDPISNTACVPGFPQDFLTILDPTLSENPKPEQRCASISWLPSVVVCSDQLP